MVHQAQRSQVILAFLGAGLDQPPDRALAVTTLADARCGLTAHQAGNQPIDAWLAEEVRHGGLRENAATLAVRELPEHQAPTAPTRAGGETL